MVHAKPKIIHSDPRFVFTLLNKVSVLVFLCFCLAGGPEKLEECVLSDQSPLSSGVDSGQQSPVSPENRKSQRGIKKLWGKYVLKLTVIAH